MSGTTKTMNHSQYIKDAKKKAKSELEFIIKDCQNAIEAGKSFNPNCGYYMDEIHYCAAELKRREDKARK